MAGNNKQQKSRLDQWLELNKSQQNVSDPAVHSSSEAPLSYGQLRLWLINQLQPDSPVYNYAESYDIKGDLGVDHLIQSFRKIVLRHDVLRTVFPTDPLGKPFQQVKTDLDPEIRVFGTEPNDTALNVDQAEAILLEESVKPFDLAKGPLVRLVLVKVDREHFKMAVVMHHMITDKWSMNVLREEWAALYRGGSLEPVVYQYSDFAKHQRQQQISSSHLGYWKQKLAGDIPVMELPAAKSRKGSPSYRGAFSEKSFSSEQSRKLIALSSEFQTTGFILFLTIFKILLYRYTGLGDLMVASPVTNRDQTKLEKVIGFFNETVVLRSQLSRDMTFSEAVEQVKKTVLDAFAHKNVPFETLVSTLKPERLIGSNPLFQVMFLYHQTPNIPNLDRNISWIFQTMDLGVAKFDLTMYVAETNGQFTSIIEYATDKFDSSTIEQIHGHLSTLVDGILTNPNKHLYELPILPEGERRMILDEWNNTNKTVDFTLTHELIAKKASESPEQPAIVFKGSTTSFGELHIKARQIARNLNQAGIDIGDHVGIAVSRSTEMIASILGVLYAGAAYVPLDIKYPLSRLKHMAKDSSVSLLLTTEQAAKNFAEWNIEMLLVDNLPTSNGLSGGFPKPGASDNAYIIYTSGSSGKPKGVPISHRSLAHSTAARFNYYSHQPEAFLLMSSFSFDSSVAGIFWTLSSGGTLVLPEDNAEQDILALSDLISTSGVTHTLMLPSLYGLLLSNTPADKLKSLNTVIVAGEACPASVCDLHFAALPNANLYNEYGPTEGTVWSTVYQVPPGKHMDPIPIGRPIGNTQVYILDPELAPVPVGIIGQLYIGGAGISEGYLNSQLLTEEKFINNPFADGKLYATGDLARYQPNGNIEFLGRSDQQVKIRGYRIEVSEIQHTIEAYPGVEAATIVLQNPKPAEVDKVDVDNTERLTQLLMNMDPLEADYLLTSIESIDQFSAITEDPET